MVFSDFRHLRDFLGPFSTALLEDIMSSQGDTPTTLQLVVESLSLCGPRLDVATRSNEILEALLRLRLWTDEDISKARESLQLIEQKTGSEHLGRLDMLLETYESSRALGTILERSSEKGDFEGRFLKPCKRGRLICPPRLESIVMEGTRHAFKEVYVHMEIHGFTDLWRKFGDPGQILECSVKNEWSESYEILGNLLRLDIWEVDDLENARRRCQNVLSDRNEKSFRTLWLFRKKSVLLETYRSQYRVFGSPSKLYKVGDVCKIISSSITLKREDLESEIWELKFGTILEVAELGQGDRIMVKSSTPALIGWIRPDESLVKIFEVISIQTISKHEREQLKALREERRRMRGASLSCSDAAVDIVSRQCPVDMASKQRPVLPGEFIYGEQVRALRDLGDPTRVQKDMGGDHSRPVNFRR